MVTARAEATLLVSEVFGPTIQGEGPGAGRPAIFVRLGLCNLDCSWCDTPYTWDWSGKNGTVYDRNVELTRRDVAELADEVIALGAHLAAPPMVVITGGEPLVQAAKLDAFVLALLHRGVMRFEIETNGTHVPSDLLVSLSGIVTPVLSFNCSPKLHTSGVDPRKAIVFDALDVLGSLPSTAFKFVVSTDHDIAQVAALVDGGHIRADQVVLMPEGRTPAELAERFAWLFDTAATRGWRISHRLHVLAHNDERGY